MMLKQMSIKSRFLVSNIKQMIHEQQRFRRYLRQPKPLWKPISIEKLFNVPVKKETHPEDEACIEQEEPIYLNKYRSIKEYLYQEFTIPVLQGGTQTDLKATEEEHRRLIEENKQENDRIAKLREERKKIQDINDEFLKLKTSLIKNEKYLTKKEEAIRLILREKERYPNYITKEKLKDAIENAIDHPTSYEFAIDLKGTLVFEKRLHPYALEPSAVPESDDIIHDYIEHQPNNQIRLNAKKLFYD